MALPHSAQACGRVIDESRRAPERLCGAAIWTRAAYSGWQTGPISSCINGRVTAVGGGRYMLLRIATLISS